MNQVKLFDELRSEKGKENCLGVKRPQKLCFFVSADIWILNISDINSFNYFIFPFYHSVNTTTTKQQNLQVLNCSLQISHCGLSNPPQNHLNPSLGGLIRGRLIRMTLKQRFSGKMKRMPWGVGYVHLQPYME